MLIACTKERTTIIAPEGSESKLREMGRAHDLICPACKGLVFYRSGSLTPHFVHYESECNVRYSEPESKAHLAAKWAIYQALIVQGFSPILELYFPEIRQRSDISVVVGDRTIAIEVQMSHIANRVWLERRELYKSIGVEDFWYFGCHPNGNIRLIDHPQQSFIVGGYPNNGDWIDCEETNQAEHDHVQVIAQPSIQQDKFSVDLITYQSGKNHQNASDLGSVTIPMNKCAFIRGVPVPRSTQQLPPRIARHVADKLKYSPWRQHAPSQNRNLLEWEHRQTCHPSRKFETNISYNNPVAPTPGVSYRDPVAPTPRKFIPCPAPIGHCRGWPHTTCQELMELTAEPGSIVNRAQQLINKRSRSGGD